MYVHNIGHIKEELMKTITATSARNHWFELLKDLVKGHRVYRITSKEGGAILLSEEDYESLIETLELLSTPGLLKGVNKAKKEIKEGKTYSMEDIFGAS